MAANITPGAAMIDNQDEAIAILNAQMIMLTGLVQDILTAEINPRAVVDILNCLEQFQHAIKMYTDLSGVDFNKKNAEINGE